MNNKIWALRKFLIDENLLTKQELKQTKIEEISIEQFHVDSLYDEFYVLTDKEADEKAKDYILDTVWAFNPYFLECHTGIDSEIFELLADKCESSNEAILSMIKDQDEFVKDAISSDGRGHFISCYDGNEHEINVDNEYFYIYQI